mmetsp:Transcript_29406/g.29142  ORF Transcript_29406/g.29142 Transcript_29406/m.29142 type:complete len:245 (+) Transcript_29406:1-735(+)
MKGFFSKKKKNRADSPEPLPASPKVSQPRCSMMPSSLAPINTDDLDTSLPPNPSPTATNPRLSLIPNSLPTFEVDNSIKSLKEKISDCDKEITKLSTDIERSKGSLKSSYQKRLKEKKSQRLVYEKQMDTLITKQFSLEQKTFELGIKGLVKQALGVRIILDRNKKEEEQKAAEILEETKNVIEEVEEIKDELASYKVDVEEDQLDMELEDMYEEVNKEPEKKTEPPWYLKQTEIKNVKVVTEL